eukprot:TRINITY_DN7392_c0_g1_i1.p1 TRINITY_DN7392_c0_g1~~TRINITY_DN7392_c0_g1_i1.p1  ORF type:complete len:1411 (+),score=306.06 TRINITY_DN7392_c0_g1_i1:3-4235(+)
MRYLVPFLVLLVSSVNADVFNVGPTLRISSLQVKTHVYFEIDSSLGSPRLTVTPMDSAPAAFISFNGVSLSLSQDNTAFYTGANAASNVVPIWSVVAALVAMLSLSHMETKIIFITASVMVITMVSAAVPVGYYSIKVSYPPNYGWTEVSVEINEGSIGGSDLFVQQFSVNHGSGIVSLSGLSSKNVSVISSNGDIAIGGIKSQNGGIFKFSAGKTANIRFNSFSGSGSVLSSTTVPTVTGSQCTFTPSSNRFDIICGSACSSSDCDQVEIHSMEESNAVFGLTPCSSTYRDPEASDSVPISPGITSTVPAHTWKFDNFSRWRYQEESQYSYNGAVLNETGDGELLVNQTNGWHASVFWLTCHECLPQLRMGYNYQLKFSIKQSVNNTWDNSDISDNILWVRSAILKHPYKGGMNYDSTTINSTAPRVLWLSDNMTTSISESYTELSASVTLNDDLYSGYFVNDVNHWDRNANWNPKYAALVIGVMLKSPPNGKGAQWWISGVSLTQLERVYTAPTLLPLNYISELASIPTMSASLDPNPRTNCPWNEPNLKLWSDPATWGGNIPDRNSEITLPENTKVLVTSCTFNPDEIYKKITIPATSELIFSDANIELHIKTMVVNGKLRIGSPQCRLYSQVKIVFEGSRDKDDTTTPYGTKGIFVPGSIDIHGKQYNPTWTRLRGTAYPGDDRIYLQDAVNWEVGMEVVIATTFWMDEYWPQNEVMKIKAIDSSMKIIQFTEPLKFHHYAGAEYQAEVGLLTRRIVLQGGEYSDGDRFGGHVMVTGEGRFSGVQAYKMGQRNIIARYPFHYHLGGIQSTSFVKDCACKHTYYRCVTVHATHELEITRNVAFDVTGHTYYLEDGVEENNTLAYNLAVYVHVIGKPAAGGGQGGDNFVSSDDLKQPADAAAAGFYITNAYNKFIGNAASGGWSGFSFPNLYYPIGPSNVLSMDPSGKPTLVFEGNTAHSSGYYWSMGTCIYIGGKLSEDASNNNILKYNSGRNARATRLQLSTETYSNSQWNSWASPNEWMKINNTKVFLCQHGLNHWGERVDLTYFEAHDVTRGSTIFGTSWMGHAIVNQKSNNPITGMQRTTGQGFQFYDTWSRSSLSNVTFRNFNTANDTIGPTSIYNDNVFIISMTHSDKFKPQGIAAVGAIKSENSSWTQRIGHYIRNTGASRYYNFVDSDGSLTSSSGPSIVGSHSDWWLLSNSCKKDWSVWICPKDNNTEIANLNILVPNLIADCTEPPHGTSNWVGYTALWGDGIGSNRSSPITKCPGVTGVTNKGWYLYLDGGSPPSFTVETYIIPKGLWIMLAIGYPAGTTFTIKGDSYWNNNDFNVTQASSFNEVSQGNGTKYFYDEMEHMLYVKLVDPMADETDWFVRENVRIATINNGFAYKITTSCSSSASCYVPETIPTRTL